MEEPVESGFRTRKDEESGESVADQARTFPGNPSAMATPNNTDSTNNGRQNARDVVTAALNPLPRSVRRDGEYLLLDGEWRFNLDLDDEGRAQEWFKGHDYTSKIMWPSNIESVMNTAAQAIIAGHPEQLDMAEGTGQGFSEGYDKPDNVGKDTGEAGGADNPLDQLIGWYEREFTVPQQWLEDPQKMVLLTFGGCGFETTVWLNGNLLTTVEGEQVHMGEYTSFSYELPTERLQPRNRLTVRTADSLDPEIPRGKQESRVYKRGGIWYQTISGPVRSIWIEPVMRNRLRSRLGVVSSIEDKLVEFALTTRVRDAGEYRLRLSVVPRGTDKAQGAASDGKPDSKIDDMEIVLHLRPGEHRQRVVMNLKNAEMWDPDSPNLYRLLAELVDPSGAVSKVDAPFGMRKIEARGRWVYLNNRRTYLDGILYQPGTSSLDEIARHLQAIKELGCNLTRVHIAGIDPRIYDLADQMGMMLWVEVPSPHTSSQRSREHHWAELQRTLSVIASHPSVVILSLYNEDWGIQDVASNPQVRRYLARTFASLKVNYPQLLVVDNDGWKHVSNEGRLESHLLTAHVYTDDVEKWGEILGQFETTDNALIQITDDWGYDLTVGDPYFYRGQVPLIISEWGGFGWKGYGGPSEAQAKADKIRAYKKELLKCPIAGDIYTQATSIEDEVNGLIDPHTGELQVPPGVLALIQRR